MENKEKLEVLKSWLTENGYKFAENYVSKTCGVIIPLRVFDTRIAVRIGDDSDFFERVKRGYAPFFIRDNESAEFVIEKMQNCIEMVKEKKRIWEETKDERRKAKNKRKKESKRRKKEAERAAREAAKTEKPKRKRVRIIRAEKV